jgi:thymidylate synthase
LIFGTGQFIRVANELIKDKYSRRAVIQILLPEHFKCEKDIPCTKSIQFFIRNDVLEMDVQMRSNDIIFGFFNDIAFFSVLHEMMYVYLRDFKYPNLQYGTYYHMANSMHCYERHYEMLDNIIDFDTEWVEEPVPRIHSIKEVINLMYRTHRDPEDGWEFTRWLHHQK